MTLFKRLALLSGMILIVLAGSLALAATSVQDSVLLAGNLTGPQHLGIPVTDIARSREFYRRLGFREVMTAEIPEGTGTIKVAVIPTVLVIPVNLNGAGLGVSGSTNAPFTFDAAPWTTGVGQVNTGVNVASLTGSNSNVSGGPITLVTPTFVLAIGNLLPIFAVLTLGQGAHAPVPEPGSLLLIGTGIAGLALLGRRRK